MVRIIIADDEPDIRLLVKMSLRTSGYDIVSVGEAENGAQAVQLWREQRPDVVIMDNRMPVMSGLEAAAVILAADRDARIVLVSAFLTDGVAVDASALGVRRCLHKNELRTVPDVAWELASA